MLALGQFAQSFFGICFVKNSLVTDSLEIPIS